MTPEKALESLLVERIQAHNFESSRTQVLPMQQTQQDATLPRIVVECTVSQDTTLSQAAVFPCSVTASIHLNAMDGSDNYLLDPLIEAVDATLLCWEVLEDFRVKCYGGILGDAAVSNSDDTLERTISATLWAALK